MATILIVDDHPDNRAFLVTLLGYQKHRLLEAADGAEALTVIRAERPDLVIADVLMPTMDGYELVRQLRADPAIAGTAVIFYTAHYHEREAQSLAQSCGVSYILTKPADPEVVLRIVEQALGLSAPPPVPPPVEFDREHLRLLTDKLSATVDELRFSNERLHALVDISVQLASERNLARMLNDFCQAARDLIGGRYAVVGVAEEDEERLRYWFTSGLEPQAWAGLEPIAARQGVLGQLMAERRPRRLRDLQEGDCPPVFPRQLAVRSFLGVPLMSPLHVYGWICLADKLGAEEFSDEDERLLGILAALMGRVYENGRYAAMAHQRAVELEAEVAERQRVAEALRVSEEHLRQALEASRMVAWNWEPRTDRSVLSANAREIIGCDQDQLVNAHEGFELVHPADRERHRTLIRGAKERCSSYTAEFRVIRPDNGRTIWLEDRGNVQCNREDRVVSMSGVLHDITERKAAEEARRQSDLRFRAIFHQTFELVALLRPDGSILEVNQTALDFRGLRSAEVVGLPIWETPWLDISEEARQQVREAVAAAANGSFVRQELIVLDRNRQTHTFDFSMKPVRDEDGTVELLIGEARDITEYKQLEQQYLQAQKMEAVGQLAGGVAHDFNNLLTVIGGFSEMIHQSMPATDARRPLIEEVKKAGERAAILTRQLLAFSRKQVIQPRLLDLNAVIADAQKMLARLIGEDVELRFIPANDLGRTKADAGQIEQVLMNLAVNARDAMPHGGKLIVQTRNTVIDGDCVQQHHDVKPGAYILIEVSDTGTGMTAEVQARIFEPFFTTKEVGKGTGLGLATVYGIMKQNGGQVLVYSEPGRGTTFKLYFPQAQEAGGPARPSGVVRTSRPGTETVLLVEDEQMIRSMVRTILQANGYTVLEAGNGAEALRLAEQQAGPIHLLLADVVMPRMSGRDLAEHLRVARANMRVLFMSGYAGAVLAHHGILEEEIHFLQKPFTTETLLRAIREVLDAP
jgi:two-component system cell cycle sensor histidine kinase/response regulator CckA